MTYLVVALLVAIGIFFTIKPNTVWKYNHYFTVKDGEPSDLYLICVRLTGVLFIILGLVYLGVMLFY